MKRIHAIIMTLLLVFSIAACTAGPTDKPSPEGDDKAAEVSDSGKENGPAETEANDTGTKSDEISFKELVVVDNDECAIRITRIDPNNMWGYTLKANLENKSAEKTYMFSIQNAAVNGVECDPFFATEVAPGKKSNEDISFPDDTLKANGINEFTDIEVTFRVYDTDELAADPVALETVHVYPFGEEKAAKFVRESQPTDIVIYNNENVSVIVTGYTDDPILGYTVNVYLENKTDKTLMFSVDEVSVNGYMADPFWAKEVYPGKAAFTSMSWSDTTFDENDITEVEEIEFLLKVYDSNDLMADNLIEETITLKP
jgi:hypothetical protein